jgi:hypothetical protein
MAPIKESASAPGQSDDYTRLHITPFNPQLFSAIVPPSIAPRARNISFHQIQNFPEKAYGFVELPVEDAQRIKKKLSGAILRGTKIEIAEARPRKAEPGPDPETEANMKRKDKKEKEASSSAEKESKKRKRHEETIPGQELHDRQVKRGWTDPDAKKKKHSRSGEKKEKKKEREKSKYTTQPECLFRTTLPPSVAADIPPKGMEGVIIDKKEKRKSKKGKDVVLHEFARTEKFATFLKQKAPEKTGKEAVEFVEGKGWVDEDGLVVEQVVPKEDRIAKKPRETKADLKEQVRKLKQALKEAQEAMDATEEPESETSSSGSSSDEDDEESSSESEAGDAEEEMRAKGTEAQQQDEAPVPETIAQEEAAEPQAPTVAETASTTEMRPATPNQPPTTTTALKVSIPPITAASPQVEVHPLEALYKRRKPDAEAPTLPEAAPSAFTFFGGESSDIDDEEEEAVPPMPMTPFTQKDIMHRSIRSAAPTPDTAHPGKQYMSWSQPEEEDDEDSGDSGDAGAGNAKAGGKDDGKEETDPNADFSKWFYEHRGDANRAWKKRRKMAGKEARQRENRKRTGGAA